MLKFYGYRFQTAVFIIIFIKNIFHSKYQLGSTENDERIVTDLEIIDSFDAEGVPVDYSYNETHAVSPYYEDGSDIRLPSDPGCPKSIDGIPCVQYGNPPKCYLVGYKGPCDSDEILILKSLGSKETTCACKALMEEDDPDALEASDDGKFLFSSLYPYKMMYTRSDNKCHWLYSQGDVCENDFVLVRLRNTSTVKCLPDRKLNCGYNYETQTCEVVLEYGQGGGGGGAFGPVLPFSCGSKEKYSTILKRCLKKKGTGFVLG